MMSTELHSPILPSKATARTRSSNISTYRSLHTQCGGGGGRGQPRGAATDEHGSPPVTPMPRLHTNGSRGPGEYPPHSRRYLSSHACQLGFQFEWPLGVVETGSTIANPEADRERPETPGALVASNCRVQHRARGSFRTLSSDNSRVEDAFSTVMMFSTSNRRHRRSQSYNEGVHCARKTWHGQANYKLSRNGCKILLLLLPRQRLSTIAIRYSYR